MSFEYIPDHESLNQEILKSHERCRRYGIDPYMTRNVDQIRLSPDRLRIKLEQNKDFLEVAIAQIKEIYRFVEGAGFVVSIADKEGYLIEIIGDNFMIAKMEAGNLLPGYRWTEKDVGTSAVSLALERKIPVQVNDNDHFCRRGHNYTCSASPIFMGEKELLGAIALSGQADQVHPHTLGMVITAARAIENQMQITKTSHELLLHNNYMNAIIDSIDSGVIAINKNGIITQVNDQGKRILQVQEELEGKPLSSLLGSQLDLKQMMHAGFGYVDREVFIDGLHGVIQLIHTAKPIFDVDGNVQGIIFVFHEINRIRKLVNDMAGIQARFTFEDIIGISPSFQEAKKLAMLAAAGHSNVLLMGETGTGKELFAQSIHNQNKRRHPFVAINCGAIPRELLESELFGYVEGAFTGARKGGRPGKFELANGGTVLLDEIGDMPSDMQVKLLRVLQTGEVHRIGEHKPISVDIRVIAATHYDLKKQVVRGNFREDLFYRLNVFPIYIPPLRERTEDIIPLAKHILARCSKVIGKGDVKFSPKTEQSLLRYGWPGNVRELENTVERAMNLVNGEMIHPEQLGIPTTKKNTTHLKHHWGSMLEEVEKQTIMEILEEMAFNLSKTAKTLGISRATLYNKIKKYNLSTVQTTV